MNEREKRVLGYMVVGMHSQEIAAALGINGSMAKALMNSVLVELGAYESPRPLPPGRRHVEPSDESQLISLQSLLRLRWGLDAVDPEFNRLLGVFGRDPDDPDFRNFMARSERN
jgi:hypothetical protein